MTTHPLADVTTGVYRDGINVSKGGIRSYEALLFLATSLSDLRTRDLTGTIIAQVPIGTAGRSFWIDSSDTTTVDDGATCIVDAAGNRFKVRPAEPTDFTAAVLNAAFGPGGIAYSSLPGSGTRRFLGRGDDDAWSTLSVPTMVTWLDAYLGNTDWRMIKLNNGGAGTVHAFLSNDSWRCGGMGALNNVALFDDGTVGVCGNGAAASGLSPNTTGGNLGRFQKIPFADGVDRTIVKHWVAGYNTASLWCQTSDGYNWAYGGNVYGQLGIGNVTNQTAGWVEVSFFRTNGLTVVDVIPLMSGLGAYFRTSNGWLYYTGYNGVGQAGTNDTTQKNSPVRVGTLTNVTYVHAGYADTNAAGTGDCIGAISGGVPYVWGYSGYNNLGINTTTTQLVPVATSLSGITKIRMGAASAALKNTGALYTCGLNLNGGPGLGTTTGNTTTWTQIASLGTTVLDFEILTGNTVAMAAIVTVAGSGRFLRTWGYAGAGITGTGATADTSTVQSPTATWQGSVDELAFGGGGAGYGNLFVRVVNDFYGTGYNNNRQIVCGDSANHATFTKVLGVRGTVLSWWLRGYSQYSGVMVLTDKACLSGGENSYGPAGIQETGLSYSASLQEILVGGNIKGDNGINGVNGESNAVRFTFSTTTTDADPGAGSLRLNNVAPASATQAFVDDLDILGASIAALLDTYDDGGTITARGVLTLVSRATPGTWHKYLVTGASISAGGYHKLSLTWISGNGTFANGETIALLFDAQGSIVDYSQDAAIAAATVARMELKGWPIMPGFSAIALPDQPLPSYMTLTRASVAWSRGANGLLRQYAANQIRHGWDSAGKYLGWRFEGAATNVVLWNRDLTNAAWTKSTMTVANVIGADGVAASGSSLTATSANATVLQAITLASSVRYHSAYVKRLVGAGTIEMTMDGGTTWVSIGGQLNSNTFTEIVLPTQTIANPNVGFRIGTSGDAIAVDFVQNETTRKTSPMATTTAAFTRAADTIADIAISTWFNTLEGALLVRGTTPFISNVAESLLSLDDGTANEQIKIQIPAAGSTINLNVQDGGATQANITNAITANTEFIICGRYRLNDFASSRDGAAVVIDVTGTIPTPTAMKVARERTNTSPFYGFIRQIAAFGIGPTNANLQTLSTP